jgi:hypothetical protein
MFSSPARRPGLALIAGLIGVPSLLLATAAAPAPTAGAAATGLQVALDARLGGEEVVDIDESFASTEAGPTAGTDSDTVIPVEIPELLTADLIQSESSVETAANTAEAEVVGLHLRLSDEVELVEASVLSSSVECPEEGATTADAQLVDLQLLEQNVNLDTGETIDVRLPVDLDIPDVANAHVHVTARQIEETSANSASATALQVLVSLTATVGEDQELVHVEVGEINLAESSCERPTAAAADGDAPDGGVTDDDGATPGDDEGDDGPTLPLPGDDDNGDNGDEGDEGDETGLPGADDLDAGSPSADSLNPDRGPAAGDTPVTVDGQNLDEATEVSIGGQIVEFTVNDDGTELYFTTPGGPVGTVDVVISFGDDDSDTLEFTYEEDGSESDVLAEGAEDDGAAGDGAAGEGAAGDGGDGFGGEGQAGALAATGSDALPVTIALSMLLLAAGAWLLSQRTRTGTDTV